MNGVCTRDLSCNVRYGKAESIISSQPAKGSNGFSRTNWKKKKDVNSWKCIGGTLIHRLSILRLGMRSSDGLEKIFVFPYLAFRYKYWNNLTSLYPTECVSSSCKAAPLKWTYPTQHFYLTFLYLTVCVSTSCKAAPLKWTYPIQHFYLTSLSLTVCPVHARLYHWSGHIPLSFFIWLSCLLLCVQFMQGCTIEVDISYSAFLSDFLVSYCVSSSCKAVPLKWTYPTQHFYLTFLSLTVCPVHARLYHWSGHILHSIFIWLSCLLLCVQFMQGCTIEVDISYTAFLSDFLVSYCVSSSCKAVPLKWTYPTQHFYLTFLSLTECVSSSCKAVPLKWTYPTQHFYLTFLSLTVCPVHARLHHWSGHILLSIFIWLSCLLLCVQFMQGCTIEVDISYTAFLSDFLVSNCVCVQFMQGCTIEVDISYTAFLSDFSCI